MDLKYNRILLKLSGEALAGDQKFGLNYDIINPICEAIRDAAALGAQIAVVVGGGNFWRGRSSGSMDRTRADHIGMLGTAMNALAVADALEHLGVDVRVQTAIAMQQVAEPYIRNRAVRHLEKAVSLFLAVEPVIPSSRPIPLLRCALLRSMLTSFLKRRWSMGYMIRTRISMMMQLSMIR